LMDGALHTAHCSQAEQRGLGELGSGSQIFEWCELDALRDDVNVFGLEPVAREVLFGALTDGYYRSAFEAAQVVAWLSMLAFRS